MEIEYWIAKDKYGYVTLHHYKPIYGGFYREKSNDMELSYEYAEGWHEKDIYDTSGQDTDADEGYHVGADIDPTLTFENSPKQVKIELL